MHISIATRLTSGRSTGAGGGALPPQAPTLTAPADALVFLTDEIVAWTATTTDGDLDDVQLVLDPGGGETVLATDASSPYGGNWTVAQSVGAHTLVARARRGGQTTDSAAINLTIADAHIFVDTFIAAGTWTKPANCCNLALARGRAWVKCQAPGGGGVAATGSGGAGALAITPDVDVSGAATFDFAGLGASASGADGSNATFGTTIVVAEGGKSGTTQAGGLAANSTGTTKRSGGNGVAGAGNTIGGASSGEDTDAVTTTPGEPDGSGVGASGGLAGRGTGGGSGSTGASSGTGARGMGVVMGKVPRTTGYARRTGVAKWRATADATSHAVDLTDLGTIPAGVKLIAYVAVDGAPASLAATGWNTVATASNTTNVTVAMFEKTSVGADTLTVTMATGEQIAVIVEMWAGALTPTADGANGSSTNANPPAHTPAAGSAKYWFKIALAVDASGLGIITGLPANYGGMLEVPAFNTSGAHLVVVERQLEGTTDDPGTFTNATEQWGCLTGSIGPA